MSFTYDDKCSLYEQFLRMKGGEGEHEIAIQQAMEDSEKPKVI
jgi:hypothetical protein